MFSIINSSIIHLASELFLSYCSIPHIIQNGTNNSGLRSGTIEALGWSELALGLLLRRVDYLFYWCGEAIIVETVLIFPSAVSPSKYAMKPPP